MIKLVLVLGAIIALLFWGSADASRDEIVARIAIVAVLAVLFPFVYLWKLIGTPPAMEKERDTSHEAEVADLQKKLSSGKSPLSVQTMMSANRTAEGQVTSDYQVAITNLSSDTDVTGIEVQMLDARTIDGPIRLVERSLLNSDGQRTEVVPVVRTIFPLR